MGQPHTISLFSGIYENKAFRFALYPGQREHFSNFPFLETKHPLKMLTVHHDAEGMARSSNRSVKFLYKPTTGNFKVYLPQKQILEGNIQTGEFESPHCSIQLEKGDQIFGFGAGTRNKNRNDQCFELLNVDTLLFTLPENSYSSFPFFMIKKGTQYMGVLLNSVVPFRVYTQSENKESHHHPAIHFTPIEKNNKSLDFDFVVFAGTPADILEKYSDLTGRPFLPPLWSLGLHQSRWSYKSANRVLEIVNKFRQEHIPCDAIHLDIHYMDRYRVFTWHPKRFSSPASLHAKLKEQEFHSVVILDPGIAKAEDNPIYKECVEKNYYCFQSDGSPYVGFVWPGKTIFPDFTQEKVRDWWASKHKILFDAGVDGIWNDMNDPTLYMGRNIDPLKEDIGHENHTHAQVRNYYANFQAMATQKSFSIHKPGQRNFLLTRSGSCGIQKYAALWTGDNLSKWSHLRENLYTVINLGLSGAPFTGADVGGFAGGLPLPGLLKIIKVIKNKELFSRWVELGSLMPFFRIHTAIFSFDQEPWSFGLETLGVARKHIRRRYRLLPYIYNLFVESAKTGAPIVRPLFYEFPNMGADLCLDQFMLGSSLLVCPVLHKKQKSIKVVLPEGCWYEYETGQTFKGEQTIEMRTPLGYYPLFIKAGTVLPTWQSAQSTKSSQAGPLIWELYPARSSFGESILDDGITQQGADLRRTHITIDVKMIKGKELELKQQFLTKDYKESPKSLRLRLPSSYTQMRWKNKKIESRNVDLKDEDRSFCMSEFDLPLGKGTFYFSGD